MLAKVSFCGQTVRIRLSTTSISLQDLKENIISEFSLQSASTTLHLKYVDEDQLTIDMLSDKHLQEAFQVVTDNNLPALRLIADDMKFAYTPRPSSSTPSRPSSAAPQSRHPLASTLLKEISETYEKVAQKVIDWWLTKMPEAYFREIDHETRQTHLRALIALQMTGQKSEISLLDKSKSVYSIIKPSNYVGLLSEVIKSLPDRPLREANIYTSIDEDLVIDVFEFEDDTSKPSKFSASMYAERHHEIQSAFNHFHSEKLSEEQLNLFLSASELQYILNAAVSEILRHFQLVQTASEMENVVTLLENSKDEDTTHHNHPYQTGIFTMDAEESHEQTHSRLMVVLPAQLQDGAFARIVRHIGRLQVDILKATMNRVYNYKGSDYLIFTFYLRVPTGPSLSTEHPTAQKLCVEIKRLPFLDDSVLSWVDEFPSFTIQEAEIVLTICKLVHCLLAEERPLVFTHYHIMTFVKDHVGIVRDLVRLCESRFVLPQGNFNNVEEMIQSIRSNIEKKVELEDCKIFFMIALNVIAHTLKVNFGFVDRFCLALRLDGKLFLERNLLKDTSSASPIGNRLEVPYAIFYIVGRGFQGFHIRFRDIARGGLRVMEPGSIEQYTVSNRALLSECYNLAAAQHLKNKDIPEGGAKALVLLEPVKTTVQMAVKSFTDGLLDLTVVPETRQPNQFTDYLSQKELIYLGPDDNITNDMIVWIYQRAVLRKYPFPDTFMSSKPGAGINHRQYGVISVGVVVLLDVAIRNIGINPLEQSFSVKITGGPDGETSGNLILLLQKYFGSHVRIVALSDKSGVAEDPAGLDSSELKRLVMAGLPITEFSRSKLSHRGHIISVSEGNGSGLKARNTMPFRVESDVFIPAFGKTYDLNDMNWRNFLADGRVSTSKLIIESANLYISPGAKQHLSANGVLIVPDSTATKGGVICSSYEILAGTLLNVEQFLQIKDVFVSEVLDRLKHFARMEGEMLFKEFKRKSTRLSLKMPTLPEISNRISRAIIQLKDTVLTSNLLDIYSMPLNPTERRQSKILNIEINEARSFFIESPPSGNSNIAIPLAEPVTSLKVQAKEAGFSYNQDYHKLCRDLLVEYVPPSLKSFLYPKSSAEDVMNEWDIDRVMPSLYKKRIIATAVACKIVYREGIEFMDELIGDSQEVSGDKKKQVTEWSLKYLVELEKTKNVIKTILHVKDLDLNVKNHIIRLLEKGGTRISIELSETLNNQD